MVLKENRSFYRKTTYSAIIYEIIFVFKRVLSKHLGKKYVF